MDKIEYTKYAYKQMKNVFNQGNISVLNELHSELSKAYEPKDIVDVMSTSIKLKELIGLPSNDNNIYGQLELFEKKFSDKELSLSSIDKSSKLKHWLQNKQNPQTAKRDESHNFMLLLCGVFDMNIQETEEFIAKAFFKRAFYKNINDTAVFYCINNKIPCKDWDQIKNLCVEELNRHISESAEHSVTYTSTMYAHLKDITNTKELKGFINQYSESLLSDVDMKFAREEIKKLLARATKIAVKIKSENSFEEYDCISENKFKKKYNAKIDTKPEYNKYLLFNFPSKASLTKITDGKGSYDSIRKALILLEFFVFVTEKAYIEMNSEERFDKFQSHVNTLLNKCGFPKLWIVNPYDKLFMYCVHHEDPLDFFRGFISDVLGVDSGENLLANKKSDSDINIKFVIDLILGFDEEACKRNKKANKAFH